MRSFQFVVVTLSLSKCWACPGSNAAGSGYPLQVLGLKTGLRAFRFYPSRIVRAIENEIGSDVASSVVGVLEGLIHDVRDELS